MVEEQEHHAVVAPRETERQAREMKEIDMKRREGQLRQCVVAFKEEMGRVAEEEWTEGQRLRWQFLEREIASLRAENAELLTKNAQDISDVVDIRKEAVAAAAEVTRNARREVRHEAAGSWGEARREGDFPIPSGEGGSSSPSSRPQPSRGREEGSKGGKLGGMINMRVFMISQEHVVLTFT